MTLILAAGVVTMTWASVVAFIAGCVSLGQWINRVLA